MNKMERYVAGFIFSEDRVNVLLIAKNRPAWQAGLYNGVGGSIERGETPVQAMERELWEESHIGVCQNDLHEYCVLNGPAWRVHFFRGFVETLKPSKWTDEEPIVVKVRDILILQTVPNLKWLVPLALEADLISPVMFYDKHRYDGQKKINVWD